MIYVIGYKMPYFVVYLLYMDFNRPDWIVVRIDARKRLRGFYFASRVFLSVIFVNLCPFLRTSSLACSHARTYSCACAYAYACVRE